MTADEIIRTLRFNARAHVTTSAIARRAGIHRMTLQTALKTGHLSERLARLVEQAMQQAMKEGYHIPRPGI
jgi:hypothetical protein